MVLEGDVDKVELCIVILYVYFRERNRPHGISRPSLLSQAIFNSTTFLFVYVAKEDMGASAVEQMD